MLLVILSVPEIADAVIARRPEADVAISYPALVLRSVLRRVAKNRGCSSLWSLTMTPTVLILTDYQILPQERRLSKPLFARIPGSTRRDCGCSVAYLRVAASPYGGMARSGRIDHRPAYFLKKAAV